MNVSIIIYYHSSRLNNLKQMLRLLYARETFASVYFELILICQDNDNSTFPYPGVKHFNLNLDTYHKSKMCNFGIKQASHEWVCILDSDRILPINYLCDLLLKVKKGNVYTLKNHINLKRDYTDEEIINNAVDFEIDFRHPYNHALHRKNMFAGNTLINRDDYSIMGQMDEDFIGYGFADNDASYSAVKAGLREVFNEGIEMHLFHPPSLCVENKLIENRTHWLGINGIRFCNKWDLPVDAKTIVFYNQVKNNQTKLEPLLVKELEKVKNEFTRRNEKK